MTLIRKAAVRVSAFVAHHASADSREWAEGLECEVAFIASDWKALGWAVSSLPVLIDRRKRPLRTLQDVPALAHKLGAASNYLNGIPAWFPSLPAWLWALTMGCKLLRATSSAERIGYALATLGWIVSGTAMYIERSRRKDPPASPAGDWTIFYQGDIGAWALYYKLELESRLERLRSPWILINALAVLLVCAGWAISDSLFAVSAIIAVPLGLSFIPLLQYSRRNIQRRLDRLNQLLAASGEDPV
jgi:hypothetical protein